MGGEGRFKGVHVGGLPEQFAALITCFCEEGSGTDVVRLQPPYSILLESWICTNGKLAVTLR